MECLALPDYKWLGMGVTSMSINSIQHSLLLVVSRMLPQNASWIPCFLCINFNQREVAFFNGCTQIVIDTISAYLQITIYNQGTTSVIKRSCVI